MIIKVYNFGFIFLNFSFLLYGLLHKKIQKQFSPIGNRTRVSRVTGGDTYHYTTEDTCVADKISLPLFVILFLASPKTTKSKSIALQQLKTYPQQTRVPNQRMPRPTAPKGDEKSVISSQLCVTPLQMTSDLIWQNFGKAYCRTKFAGWNVGHRWSSGRILACHAGDPGSIPGRCMFWMKRAAKFENGR